MLDGIVDLEDGRLKDVDGKLRVELVESVGFVEQQLGLFGLDFCK